MIAETISLACFVLLVVVFCYMIKIYTVVKNIQPLRNERARGVYVRDNQRGLPVQRDPTVYFPQAERDTRQRGTCNNSTYSKSQARRRQPQIHDERFGRKFFFLPLPPSNIQAVYHHLFSFLT